MTEAVKPKTFSLEWCYRDTSHDIGYVIKEWLKNKGVIIVKGDTTRPFIFDNKCVFHYGNSTVELVPDHHHYVSLRIHSNDKNSCKSTLEEIISNAERILIKENGKRYPLNYPKNFRIPRNKRQAEKVVPSYKDSKAYLPYYFRLEMTQK